MIFICHVGVDNVLRLVVVYLPMSQSLRATDIAVLTEREASRAPLPSWLATGLTLLAALSAFALTTHLVIERPAMVAVGVLGSSAAVVAWGWKVRWRLVRDTHPRFSAFREPARTAFASAADADIQRFSRVSFPPYQPTSAGGRLGRLDLGHASIVLPKVTVAGLQRFVRDGSPLGGKLANTAVVSGEPGSGKSVVLLELHQALWRGVLAGDHCLLPLMLKATDIRGSDFHRGVLGHPATEMPSLLLNHYKQAVEQHPGLQILIGLIETHWLTTPLAIFIDGLDELPDRQDYERIQKLLREMISNDQGRCGARHLYFLSCRSDEDLGVFFDAVQLVLPGLDDTTRTTYLNALIADLPKTQQGSLRNALAQNRAVPNRVFGRNPYFLRLLCDYFREPRKLIDEHTLDIRRLMNDYLFREARKAVAGHDPSGSSNAKADAAFNFVVGSGQRALAWLAMRMTLMKSAASDSYPVNPLYGRALIDDAFVCSYADAYQNSRSANGSLSSTSADNLPLREHDSYKSDVDRLLDEVLSGLWNLKQFESLVDRALASICEPLDLLPTSSAAPYRGWARELLTNTVRGRAVLEIVQFVRSVLAAHVIGLVELTIESTDGDTPGVQHYVARLRFRHRRLAEYYAALHLVEDARVVTATLQFQPMLSPVLNIACALGGDGGDEVLRWFVAQLPTTSGAEGRFLRDAVTEALAFAMPGTAFNAAVGALVEISIRSLWLSAEITKMLGLEGSAFTGADDFVAVASSLRTLGRLGPVLAEVGIDTAVSKDLRPWWDAYAEFGDAPDPIDRQRAAESLRPPEARSRAGLLDRILIAIEHPSEVLFRHEHSGEVLCPAWQRGLAWMVYVLTELTMSVAWMCLSFTVAFVIGALAHLEGVSDQAVVFSGAGIATFGIVGWAIFRIHRFRIDPQITIRESCDLVGTNRALRWVRLWRLGRRPRMRSTAAALLKGCVVLSGALLLVVTIEAAAYGIYYLLAVGIAKFRVVMTGIVLTLLGGVAVVSLGYAVAVTRSQVRARRARHRERTALRQWNEDWERLRPRDKLRKELLAIMTDNQLTLGGRDQALSLLYAHADSLVANTSAAEEVAEAAQRLGARQYGDAADEVIAKRLAKAADHFYLRVWHRSI